jgi:NRPS condensation-like uncharacterized protein
MKGMNAMDERGLFPTSIIDDITYCVDRAYPSLDLSYAWILTLEGEINTEISLKALDKTLRYYPKSRCILTDTYPSCKRWFRHCWKLTGCDGKDIFEEVRMPAPHATIEDALNYYMDNHASLSIKLSSHVPLKVLLIRQPTGAFLFFIMHHAAADGLSGFFFIQTFIGYYEDILYRRETTNGPTVNFEDISLPHVSIRWSDFSPRNLRPFFQNFLLSFRKPALNVFPGKSKGVTGTIKTIVRQIPPQRLAVIRGTSKHYGSTVNDYLLAAMFQTVKKWCREWITPSDRIYINVPISLRSPEDRTLSNILSGVFISLEAASIGTQEEMLPLIRKEITALAESNVARALIQFSSFLKPLPIRAKINLLKRTSLGYAPTIVLSNMGILSPNSSHQDEEGFHYLGEARISKIHGIPAVAAWPMMLLYTYNSRMIFNMAFLDSFFSPETAGRFIDSYLEEL